MKKKLLAILIGLCMASTDVFFFWDCLLADSVVKVSSNDSKLFFFAPSSILSTFWSAHVSTSEFILPKKKQTLFRMSAQETLLLKCLLLFYHFKAIASLFFLSSGEGIPRHNCSNILPKCVGFSCKGFGNGFCWFDIHTFWAQISAFLWMLFIRLEIEREKQHRLSSNTGKCVEVCPQHIIKRPSKSMASCSFCIPARGFTLFWTDLRFGMWRHYHRMNRSSSGFLRCHPFQRYIRYMARKCLYLSGRCFGRLFL